MTVPFRLDSQGKDNLRYRRDMQRLGKIIAGLPSSPSAGASGDIQLSNGAGGFTAGPLISAIAPLTTKGDLYTYSTMATRLPVGTDGQILSAHSAATTGLQWSPAPTPTPSAGTAGQVQLSDGSGNFVVGTIPVTVNTTTGAISAVGGAFTISSTGTPNIAQGQAYDYAGSPVLTALPSSSNYFFAGSGNFTLTGVGNTGLGPQALLSLTSGSTNFALGVSALQHSTTGTSNVAIGQAALITNVTGSRNIAIGSGPLNHNLNGVDNTGLGSFALFSCVNNNYNVGIGFEALDQLTTNDFNVGIGYLAGHGGGASLTTLTNCTFLGPNTTSTVNSIVNSTAIGNGATVTGSNQLILGNALVTNVIANGNLTTPVLNTTNAATAATGTFTGTMTGVQPFIGAAFKLVLIQLSGFTSAGGGVYTFPTAYTTAPTVADPLAGATITTTTTNVTVVGTSLSGAILLIGA